MFKSFMRNSVFAIATVAGIAAAVPAANSQEFGDPDVIYIDREFRGEIRSEMRRPHRDVLSERQIVRVLRDYGYRDIREISLRGDRYRVIAVPSQWCGRKASRQRLQRQHSLGSSRGLGAASPGGRPLSASAPSAWP